jgi:biotin transport system ATP-binding protein
MKAVAFRQLNALVRPDQGIVTVDGLDTSVAMHHREIRRLVGMLFQNPDNKIIGMTVEEYVAFRPGNLTLPPPEICRRVDEVLQIISLELLALRAPHTLSGGGKTPRFSGRHTHNASPLHCS